MENPPQPLPLETAVSHKNARGMRKAILLSKRTSSLPQGLHAPRESHGIHPTKTAKKEASSGITNKRKRGCPLGSRTKSKVHLINDRPTFKPKFFDCGCDNCDSYDPKDPSLDNAFRVIDSIGWSYNVMHMHPFCPRVVREFISNKPFNDEGALIRGHVFQFTPSVINQLMMTPSVNHSFGWREVVLKQAISHLTGGQCSGWTGFSLNSLLTPFQVLYRVCELNWLPGSDTDSMMKNRLRLLYAVAKRKPIDFGHLVYDQVIEVTRKTD
ncbi:PREDICTED: uncharacterized protein LOC106330886 [Brassica oleracea var. oleracea]|uniref:uncharacterized protein LOC106330886 n=1 Tax=Brassica oleracea var. oleracea TaxID=109376 RepID=UPI0006A6B4A2|nr:PREDICTED: uncharacterized protein LOC106330886 [Brassica oleracea var. oleracea]